jgi:ABC-type phosphate/phosphonate transport system substrate-binding protein
MRIDFLVAWLFVSVLHVSAVSQDIRPSELKPLRIGYTMNLFMGVSAQDAKAATRVWSERMLTEQGTTRYRVDVAVYDDMQQLADAIDSGAVDVCTCTSRDWLEWKDRLNAELWGQSTYDESLMTYVVVVNGKSGHRTLDELRGQTLLIAPNDKGAIPETWLKLMLLRRGLPETESFFAAVKTVEKPDRALLPVFFGQADVCLVRRDAFELLAELNPQIEQRLSVIAESPFYLPGVFIVRGDFDAMDREYLTRNLLTIHETVEGRQILALFRAATTVLARPEDLDEVGRLFVEYRRLRERARALAASPEEVAADHE